MDLIDKPKELGRGNKRDYDPVWTPITLIQHTVEKGIRLFWNVRRKVGVEEFVQLFKMKRVLVLIKSKYIKRKAWLKRFVCL